MSAEDEKGFSYDETPRPYAFLQWKGTNACFDFHCLCEAHLHFDGFFAYYVECPHCNRLYQMPFNLFPRLVADEGQRPRVTMERDEDLDEGGDGTAG